MGSEELRDLIEKLAARIERLEEMVREERIAAEALAVALKLLRMGGAAVDLAETARRLARAQRLASRVGDEISRSILEVLAIKGPLNITALTAELRRYRGRASKRVVSARVKRLAEEGLVKVKVKGREKVVDLPP